MKTLILVLLLCVSAFADTRSLDATSTTYTATASGLGSGPERLEFRVHDFTLASGTTQDILVWHGCMSIENPTSSPNNFRGLSNCDGNLSNAVAVTINTWPDDLIVRLQRNMSSRTFLMEVWSLDRAHYAATSIGFGVGSDTPSRDGTLKLGTNFGTSSAKIAWVRWYSTLVAQSEASMPLETGTGDLGTWYFNNSLTAANGPNFSGSASYVDTPVYSPGCDAGDDFTAKVGTASAFDGSGSRPFDGSSSLTYSWSKISGPSTLTLSSSSAESPTFSDHVSTIAGRASYVYQLTCTDSLAASSTDTVELGAVAVDSYGNVVTGDSEIDFLLDPVPYANVSDWGFFDRAEFALADTLGAAIADTANQPGLSTQRSAGTCTLIDIDSITCSGGITGLSVTDKVVITWNPPTEAAGHGRIYAEVSSVDSGTTLTFSGGQTYIVASFSAYFCNGSYPCSIGQIYSAKAESGNFYWGRWSTYLNSTFGTNAWNYYGGTLALARAFVRSGRSTYWDYFNTLASLHWQYGVDHFGVRAEPRSRDIAGLMLYAHTQGWNSSAWWNTLQEFVQDGVTRFGIGVSDETGDKRESGYAIQHTAIGARFDPDSTRHATYCTSLATQAGRFRDSLVTLDANNAYWSEDPGYNTSGFYAGKPPGNSSWRIDLAVKGLTQTYPVLADTNSTTGCNNASLASDVQEVLRKVLNWWKNYGTLHPEANHRGVFYEIHYQSQSNPVGDNFAAGTVTVTNGSTAITGSSTTFLTDDSSTFGDGTHWIQVRSSTQAGTETAVQRVASCASNTACTLASAWAFPSATSSLFTETRAASTSCGDSLADYCVRDSYSDYALTRLMPQPFGWMAVRTGDSSWLTTGDELFAAAFAGPGDGPGGSAAATAPTGVTAWGTITDWASLLPACPATPHCIAGGTGLSAYGKNMNQGLGAPGGSSYLGYRNIAGGSPPASKQSGKGVTFGKGVRF